MATNFYPHGEKNIKNGTINLVGDTIRVALMTGFAYDATHEDSAGLLTASEISDADYTAGGEILPIVSGDITVTGNVVTVDTSASGGETVFTANGSISASSALVYSETAGKVLFHMDFGGTQSSVDGTFKITWHADGLFTATVNP